MRHHHHINKRLVLLGLLFLTCTMILATQFAVTKVSYDFTIVHPSNAVIRLIGSDNASDNVRLLRIAGSNTTNVALRLALGNYTMNQSTTYTAAFGIVNEEYFPVNITDINVTSTNYTYLTIWLHGDRDANANSNLTDPSSVLMYQNGTSVRAPNTTAWTLAAGNHNPADMCSNITNHTLYSSPTPWDNRSHIRYSRNNTNATSNHSDYVWIQISITVPPTADFVGLHQGVIYLHFRAD